MTTPTGNDETQPNNLPNGYEPYPSSYPPPDSGMNPPPMGGYQPQPGSYPSGPYAAGAHPAPVPLNVNGNTVVNGDGQTPIVATIVGGFKGLFIRPWAFIGYNILGSVVLTIAMLVGFVAIGLQIADLEVGDTVPASAAWLILGVTAFVWIIWIIYQTIMYNGALQAAEGRHVGLRDIFTPRYTFRTPILVAIVVGILGGIGIVFQLPDIIDTVTHLKMVDVEGGGARLVPEKQAVSSMYIVAVAVHILMWLASPLFTYATFVALDQGTGVKDSFALALGYARSHWFGLLAYMIVMGIAVGLLSLVTFGLATIIIVPAMSISQAIMYRRISGGLHIITD